MRQSLSGLSSFAKEAIVTASSSITSKSMELLNYCYKQFSWEGRENAPKFLSYFPLYNKDIITTASLEITPKSIELLNLWCNDDGAAQESMEQALKDLERDGIIYNSVKYYDFLSNDNISQVKKKVMLNLFHQSVASNFTPLITKGDEIVGHPSKHSHEEIKDVFTFEFSDMEDGKVKPDKLFFKMHGTLFFHEGIAKSIMPKTHFDGCITLNLTPTDGVINISAETGHISITGKDWPSKEMMRVVNKQILEKIGSALHHPDFIDRSIVLSCSNVTQIEQDKPLKLIQCSIEDIKDYIEFLPHQLSEQSFNEFVKYRYYTSKIKEGDIVDSDNTLYIADVSLLNLSEFNLSFAGCDFSNIIAIGTDFTGCDLLGAKFNQSMMFFAKGIDFTAAEMQNTYHTTYEEIATSSWAKYFFEKFSSVPSNEEEITRITQYLVEDGDYIEVAQIESLAVKCSNPILAAIIREYNSMPILRELRPAKPELLTEQLDKFSKILDEKEWKIHDVQADGNCFFYAVAHQLKLINYYPSDENISHLKLRERAVSFLSENIDEFRDFIEGDEGAVVKYIKRMEADYCWADDVIATALAKKLEIKIYVEQYEKQPAIINPDAQHTIYLGNISNKHFVSLTDRYDQAINDFHELNELHPE
jgi:hypothetical protein